MAEKEFCDYYELFQVSPTADSELIDYAYRVLAKRYHPDNPDTGDPDQFRSVTEAHKTLTDLKLREEFDLRRRREKLRIDEIFEEASSENFDVGRTFVHSKKCWKCSTSPAGAKWMSPGSE